TIGRGRWPAASGGVSAAPRPPWQRTHILRLSLSAPAPRVCARWTVGGVDVREELAVARGAVEVVELREGHAARRAGAELDAVGIRQPARVAHDRRLEVGLVEGVL